MRQKKEEELKIVMAKGKQKKINPLTPVLNPSAQRCLTRYFTGDFAS
jgi:hypothetical protein